MIRVQLFRMAFILLAFGTKSFGLTASSIDASSNIDYSIRLAIAENLLQTSVGTDPNHPKPIERLLFELGFDLTLSGNEFQICSDSRAKTLSRLSFFTPSRIHEMRTIVSDQEYQRCFSRLRDAREECFQAGVVPIWVDDRWIDGNKIMLRGLDSDDDSVVRLLMLELNKFEQTKGDWFDWLQQEPKFVASSGGFAQQKE